MPRPVGKPKRAFSKEMGSFDDEADMRKSFRCLFDIFPKCLRPGDGEMYRLSEMLHIFLGHVFVCL